MTALDRCRSEMAAAEAAMQQGAGDPMLTMIWWLDWHAESALRGGEDEDDV